MNKCFLRYDVLTKFGLDQAVFFSISNRLIQATGNLLVIVFISKFLSEEEQGYYFAFSSIAALQVFFELGLSVVITQFIAHEYAFLKLMPSGDFEGNEIHLLRISSFSKIIVKWYALGSSLFFLIVTPLGYTYFNSNQFQDQIVSWHYPWIILMIGSAINLLMSPYLPFLDGLNGIIETSKFRMIQSGLALIVLVFGLYFGAGLMSLSLYALSNGLTLLLWSFINSYRDVIRAIWKKSTSSYFIDWRSEIFPLQWRIALSWLSGYLIFQLLNPIIFSMEGPVVSGQLGITMAAFSGISVVAMSWINTKIPTFSMLIAQKKFNQLDDMFFTLLRQSFFVVLTGVILFLFFLYLFQNNSFGQLSEIANRFLQLEAAVFIGLTTIANQLVFSMAAYLRSHKKEPLLMNSLVGGIVTAISAFFTTKYFGVVGTVVVNFIITLFFSLCWVYLIFDKKRKQWHSL